jgi:hypothetical protein
MGLADQLIVERSARDYQANGEWQKYLRGGPLAEAGAAMSSYGRWKNPMTPYVDQWKEYSAGAPGYVDAWRNLPGRYFESNPGWQ